MERVNRVRKLNEKVRRESKVRSAEREKRESEVKM